MCRIKVNRIRVTYCSIQLPLIQSKFVKPGDSMKRFISLFAIPFIFSAQAQECIKTDYQELKEFSDKELISKYCEDQRGFKLNTTDGEFNKSMYEAASAINDRQGTTKYLDKWGVADQAAKGCKSEMDRVLRLLAKKNVNESSADAQCPASGGVKMPTIAPLEIKSING